MLQLERAVHVQAKKGLCGAALTTQKRMLRIIHADRAAGQSPGLRHANTLQTSRVRHGMNAGTSNLDAAAGAHIIGYVHCADGIGRIISLAVLQGLPWLWV